MRHSNTYLVGVFSFIVGCMLTLSITNLDECDDIRKLPQRRIAGSETIVKYVVLIFSKPVNVERRNVTRSTWLSLKGGTDEEVQHYFAVGVASASAEQRALLRSEQAMFGDLLMLPGLRDQYSTLSSKLLQSLRWISDRHAALQFMIKCDDDSFVRIDTLLDEMRSIQKFTNGEKAVPGVYWGYFKGNARVRLKGRWAEQDWFLCDRYLPYALGGGYILSRHVVRFVANNSHTLKLYNSEDVSLGVWTAPMEIQRRHDIRFDTEWSSRGCQDSMIVRHKQSVTDMQQLYATIVASGRTRMCNEQHLVRPSYVYRWDILPNQCCQPTN